MNMTVEQIKEILRTYTGMRLRIIYFDDKAWSVDVDCVDEDGFLHSGPEGAGQRQYWTRYEAVKFIDTEAVD
ncbi:MAG TPA: hypothetical protein VIM60_02005 [Edaphobacter sp.]